MGFLDRVSEATTPTQRPKVSLSQIVIYGFFTLLVKILGLIWRNRVTMTWIFVIITAFSIYPAYVGFLLMALSVGMIFAGKFYKPIFYSFAPFTADSRRSAIQYLKAKIEHDELFIENHESHLYKNGYMERYNGALLLIRAGILTREQVAADRKLDVSMVDEEDKWVWELRSNINGMPPSLISQRTNEFKSVLNAVRSYSEPLDKGGLRITFYKTDPLDEVQQRHEAGRLNIDDMSVVAAVDAFGNDMSLRFKEVSGLVVGGMPGRGKSAGMAAISIPLILSEHVEMYIIDGKGGQDWDNYAEHAKVFIKGDEDLKPILEFLRSFHNDMLADLENQKAVLGDSNFWNVPAEQRLAAGRKFKILMIDECQGLFENRTTKEDKEMVAEITRYIAILVKRGRSSGYCTALITQKPTNDSLPTTIRDNATLRVAFGVSTIAAENAILGIMPDDLVNIPRAISIPSNRRGGAVMSTDDGMFKEVRFHYIPEKRQEQLLAAGVA